MKNSTIGLIAAAAAVAVGVGIYYATKPAAAGPALPPKPAPTQAPQLTSTESNMLAWLQLNNAATYQLIIAQPFATQQRVLDALYLALPVKPF